MARLPIEHLPIEGVVRKQKMELRRLADYGADPSSHRDGDVWKNAGDLRGNVAGDAGTYAFTPDP